MFYPANTTPRASPWPPGYVSESSLVTLDDVSRI